MQDSKRNGRNTENVEALVEAFLAGDESAFEAIYQLYRPKVYAFTLKRVGCPTEAEDLTQETFLQVHRSLASFGGRSNLLTWVFGIAHNVVSRYYRHCSRWMVSPKSAVLYEDEPVENRVEQRLDAARVIERCGQVLASQRRNAHQEIFHLRYRDRRSIQQVAKQVGKSPEAVKVSLRRSRNALLGSIPELGGVLERCA